MKLRWRVSFLLVVISALTIGLLTSLMHFRYHIARINMINDRLSVTLSSITHKIHNSLKLGIELERLKNLQGLIQSTKAIDPIIEDIIILSFSKGEVQEAFKADSYKLSEELKKKLGHDLHKTKNAIWGAEIDKNYGYVAKGLHDMAGISRIGILIVYKADTFNTLEKAETRLLYKRMLVCILIIIVLCIFIGYGNTREIEQTVQSFLRSLERFQAGEDKKIDLSGITDPVLRSHFRNMLTSLLKIRTKLGKVENYFLVVNNKKEQKE